MDLIILRCVFVLVAAGLSVSFIQSGIQSGIFPTRFRMDALGGFRGNDVYRLWCDRGGH